MAIACTTPNDDISAFDVEVAREVKEKGVAMASVQAILVKMREAGIPDAEIPNRLRGVDGLARLRLGRAERMAAPDGAGSRAFRRRLRLRQSAEPSRCNVAWATAPLDWAETNFRLGNACLAFGVSDEGLDRVKEAVDACLAALEEWTRERASFDWAKAP